jgi:hypothetical protein
MCIDRVSNEDKAWITNVVKPTYDVLNESGDTRPSVECDLFTLKVGYSTCPYVATPATPPAGKTKTTTASTTATTTATLMI